MCWRDVYLSRVCPLQLLQLFVCTYDHNSILLKVAWHIPWVYVVWGTESFSAMCIKFYSSFVMMICLCLHLFYTYITPSLRRSDAQCLASVFKTLICISCSVCPLLSMSVCTAEPNIVSGLRTIQVMDSHWLTEKLFMASLIAFHSCPYQVLTWQWPEYTCTCDYWSSMYPLHCSRVLSLHAEIPAICTLSYQLPLCHIIPIIEGRITMFIQV